MIVGKSDTFAAENFVQTTTVGMTKKCKQIEITNTVCWGKAKIKTSRDSNEMVKKGKKSVIDF